MRSTPRRSGADFTGLANYNTRLLSITALAFVYLHPGDVHAMHLADGVLPVRWCLGWAALALPCVLIGWHRLSRGTQRSDRLFPWAVMGGAAVFAISCMPVPIPIVGTCSHPCGTGLAAIVLGPWLTVLITAVALVIQALFLAHGGLTTLGADIVSMGIAGGFVGFAVYRGLRALGVGIVGAAFTAGLLSDWATYAVTALELALGLGLEGSTGASFVTIGLAFAPTQLPLGLFEGAITAGALAFLRRRRPRIMARIDHEGGLC